MYCPQTVRQAEGQSGSWAETSNVTSPPGATAVGVAVKLSITGAAAHAPFAEKSISTTNRIPEELPIAEDEQRIRAYPTQPPPAEKAGEICGLDP